MKKTRRRIISLITAVIMIATMIPVMAVPVAAAAPRVRYRTHVQNKGWQSWVYDGASAGTSGQSLRLEAIQIELVNNPYGGGIGYKTHIQNIGWESEYSYNGETSGTSGRALRLEAIGIGLYGGIANYYDVCYRVHAQQFGWLGWARSTAYTVSYAGTANYSYRLEAIQIKLVPKSASTPSPTANCFLSNYLDINRIGLNVSSIVTDLSSSYFTRQTVSGYSSYYKGKTLNGGITVAWGTGTNRTYIHSVNARLRLHGIVPGATKVAKANTVMTNNNYKRLSNSSTKSTWQSKSDSKARVTLTYQNGFVYGFDAYYKKS